MPDSPHLLDELRVIDLGVGMAPALVAKFLADNGARVIRVEPVGADPFYEYYPAYEVWRRGLEINMAARADPTRLNSLLATADVCLVGGEDYPGMARREDAEAIAAVNPRLVVLEITGNPAGFEDHNLPSNELLAQASSGLCYEQFSARPLFMGFQPANYGAALQGLCVLLAALYERERSGLGQISRTSLFEGAMTWIGMGWGDFERPTPQASFINPKDPHPLIFRCADGACIHFVIGASGSKYKLYQVLGIDDPSVLPGDSGMPKISSSPRNYYGDIDLLARYIEKRDSRELLEAMWKVGLPAEPVLAPGGCWDHPQALHNAIVVSDADGTRHVGNPIIAKVSVSGVEPVSAVRASRGEHPLAGLRVIDFGAYLAGPLSSAVLADLGADVIKVEPPAGDPSRSVVRGFMVANRGKRGMAIDLKTGKGIEIAQAMALKADIVCNNFRSGVSARLGIDPSSLHALKPNLIVLESPAYGSSGPLAQRAGFDMVMQAFCGHEIRAGGTGNDPLWNRAGTVDYVGGMLGAIGLLAALVFRARTGNGVALQVPLFNAGVFLLSELIQRPNGRFEGAEPINAQQSGTGPAEAFYEANDGWLAIFARGEGAGLRLAQALKIEDQVSFDVAAWHDREAAIIAEAVARRSVAELTADLQEAGVWAGACRADMEQRILSSKIARLSHHAILGRVREIGPLYRLSRSAIGSDRPLIGLGEHTVEILAERDC